MPTSNLSLHSILSVQFASRGLKKVVVQVLHFGCCIEYLTVLLMLKSTLLKLSSYRVKLGAIIQFYYLYTSSQI